MESKLLVASEYTEPSFFTDRVISGLKEQSKTYKIGLLLITKNIKNSIPIWEVARDLEIPIVIHITITGLGGTKVEPNTPSWEASLMDLKEFTAHEIPGNEIVLRIDPLVPYVTDFEVLAKIVKEASSYSITRCRTSMIDYYPFVRSKFEKAELPHSSFFQPSLSIKVEMLSELFTICEDNGMRLESCAENVDVPGLIKVGCADREEWANLGLDLPIGTPRRNECFCNVTKYDLLSHEPSCPNNCLYCYWGKYRK